MWHTFPAPLAFLRLPGRLHEHDGVHGVKPNVLARSEVPLWLQRQIRAAMDDEYCARKLRHFQATTRRLVKPGRWLPNDPRAWRLHHAFFSVFAGRVPLTVLAPLWYYVVFGEGSESPVDYVPAYLQHASAGEHADGWAASVMPALLMGLQIDASGDRTTFGTLVVDLQNATDSDVLAAFHDLRLHGRGGRPNTDHRRTIQQIANLVESVWRRNRHEAIGEVLWDNTMAAVKTWRKTGVVHTALVLAIQQMYERQYAKPVSEATVRRAAKHARDHGLLVALVGAGDWPTEEEAAKHHALLERLREPPSAKGHASA